MKCAGVDIGSSAVKACLFEFSAQGARLLQEASWAVPLERPRDSWAEHNLFALEQATIQALEFLPRDCTVSFTSAMHGLVLLDKQRRALSDAISWADLRSHSEALSLKELDATAQQRTGTPVHPMAWPAKFRWLSQHRPQLMQQTVAVTDLKSYLLGRLVGSPVPLDFSSASATGMWNNQLRDWDPSLKQHLDLEHLEWPEIREPTLPLLRGGRTLLLGAGDGPLGNLGVGATTPGRIAVSLGTSGAARIWVQSVRPVRPELFLYALDGASYVEGGAISNGSSVLDWLAQQRQITPLQVLEQASGSSVGAGGITVYPYFSGERAPFWNPDIRSQICGWSYAHSFADLARACLEGVGFCLNRLLQLLGPTQEPLRCTGGLFGSPFWCQLFADISGCQVGLSPVSQATALGAALLATEGYLERSRSLPLGIVYEPQPRSHKRYRALYRQWIEGEPNRSSSET